MVLQHPNRTVQFFIVGFSNSTEIQLLLFLFFFFVYVLTLIGNFVLILLISISPSLKTPMYFFLCNLSCLDIVYTTVTSPKLIYIIATNDKIIFFPECILQLYFFVAFWNTEYFLLTVMSYDRYMAICKPLHYTMLMNWRLCTIAAIQMWICGLLGSIPPTTAAIVATYQPLNFLNHLFCDIKALEEIAINGAAIIHTVILVQGNLLVMTCFLLTLLSYIYIITTILKIRSSKGKYKAFSTCASHLTVVSCFYILIFDLYFRPKSSEFSNQGKILTVLYAYIIPMLNPVVYSFRNKDVKEAFVKTFKTVIF